MFSFFHRSPVINIDCFTADNTAYKFAPVVMANKAKPEWVEKVPLAGKSNADSRFYQIDDNDGIGFNKSPTLRTIRSCYGFLELYKKGFILENWCDTAFNITKDQLNYHYSNDTTNILIHSSLQVSPGFDDYYIVKLMSPWQIQCKENVQIIAMGTIWDHENYDFKVMPGVLNFNSQTSSNIFLAFRKSVEKQVYIPIGTPLMHFIPLTEKKVKVHNHLVTQQELRTKTYNETGTVYGWRRTVFLNKRNQKRNERKCPFGFGK